MKMNRLPITLSPVTLDYPVACHHGYTSQVTPTSHVTRDTLISDERSF